MNYNYCILWFAERLKFSTKIAPVVVPAVHIQEQDQCIVSGFGENETGKYQDFLKAAVVELISYEWCYKDYNKNNPYDYPLTDAQVCANSGLGWRGFCCKNFQ